MTDEEELVALRHAFQAMGMDPQKVAAFIASPGDDVCKKRLLASIGFSEEKAIALMGEDAPIDKWRAYWKQVGLALPDGPERTVNSVPVAAKSDGPLGKLRAIFTDEGPKRTGTGKAVGYRASDKSAPAYQIILLMVILGPLFGTLILSVPTAIRTGSLPASWGILIIGYWWGTFPALVSGISFCFLRKYLGQSYRCAAASGIVAAVLTPLSPVFFLFIASVYDGDYPSIMFLISRVAGALVFGAVPAMLVFLVAHKVFGMQRFGPPPRREQRGGC